MFIEMFPFTLRQGSFDEPWERQKEPVEESKRVDPKLPIRWDMQYFQVSRPAGDRTAIMKKEDIAASVARIDPRLPKNYISPILIGCVLYKFPFSPEYHATGFIYNVSRHEPTQPKGNFLIEINKTLPQASLKLELFPFGGRYTD